MAAFTLLSGLGSCTFSWSGDFNLSLFLLKMLYHSIKCFLQNFIMFSFFQSYMKIKEYKICSFFSINFLSCRLSFSTTTGRRLSIPEQIMQLDWASGVQYVWSCSRSVAMSDSWLSPVAASKRQQFELGLTMDLPLQRTFHSVVIKLIFHKANFFAWSEFFWV